MNNQKQRIGHWGEDAAAEYLAARGYAILARNVRMAHGEIDLVACKEDLIIFIEVKTRTSSTYGYPEESVTPRKQAYMLSAAEQYLQEYPAKGDNWQFDVISVEGRPGSKPIITHFENVIT